MKVLESFTIKGDANLFFQKDFEWKNIPQFSVITGINGSGKTQLLERIKIDLSSKGKKDIFFYREASYATSIFQKNLDKRNFDQKNLDLVNRFKSLKIDFAQNNQIRDRLRIHEPKIHYLVSLIEKIHGNLENISDHEIEDFSLSFPAEKLSEDINNVNVLETFLRFIETKNRLKAKAFDLGISKENGGEEFVANGLKDFYGSSDAPWDIINQKLCRYGFEHRIKDPGDIRNDLQFFATRNSRSLGFNNLSSGERAIVELIIWSYDLGKNYENNNHNKLLMMDEFDSHLNPSMAEIYIEVLKDVLVAKFNMQVIITTHSPSTVAYCNEEDLFWMEGGSIEKKQKHEIIELLTPGILTFQRDRLLLLSSKSYIIFTEGETDIAYIKAASKKLGFEAIFDKCDFISAYGDKGKDYFNIFKKSNSSKKIITIFDYDKKGITAFDSISDNNQKKIDDKNCDYSPKIYREGNSIAILIPLNYLEYETECKNGYHPIEFLFKKSDLEKFQGNFLIKLDCNQKLKDKCKFLSDPKNIQVLNLTQEQKGKFSEFVEENSNYINFDNFKPLLEVVSRELDFFKS